jgi:hypothetical protein
VLVHGDGLLPDVLSLSEFPDDRVSANSHARHNRCRRADPNVRLNHDWCRSDACSRKGVLPKSVIVAALPAARLRGRRWLGTLDLQTAAARIGGVNELVRPGQRIFVLCEGGPCLSRLEDFPPRLEIAERGGTYVLVDEGRLSDWRYLFVANEY